MADYRPNWMAFVLYVGPQSFLGSNIIAGSQVMVTPDGKGSTQQTTSTIDVSCCKRGAVLTQSHVQPDGSIIAYTFNPATQNDWNRALAAWQQQLVATHQQQLAAANRQKVLKSLTDQLDSNVTDMKNTGIPKDLDDMRAALKDEHKALDKMQTDLAKEKQDAAVSPMTCQQAHGTVSYDYNGTLSYDLNGTLSYAQNSFQTADADLKSRLANSQKLVTDAQGAIGQLDPTNWGGTSVAQGYLESARSNLATYQGVVASAQKEQPGLEADHAEVAKQAKSLMDQGKGVMDGASAAARC